MDMSLTKFTVICCPLFAPVKPLKLSWPREGDRRRAIVGQPHPDEVIAEIAPIYSSHIIQVSDRDVAKHYQLSGTMPSSKVPCGVRRHDLCQNCTYRCLRT